VPRAIIDGKKLASRKLMSREEDLLNCIVNKEECRRFITIPRIQFQGPDGEEKATVVIQAF